jgi:hypothetical protein
VEIARLDVAALNGRPVGRRPRPHEDGPQAGLAPAAELRIAGQIPGRGRSFIDARSYGNVREVIRQMDMLTRQEDQLVARVSQSLEGVGGVGGQRLICHLSGVWASEQNPGVEIDAAHRVGVSALARSLSGTRLADLHNKGETARETSVRRNRTDLD